jgi:peptidoglycan hydrolase CwlO-like protein
MKQKILYLIMATIIGCTTPEERASQFAIPACPELGRIQNIPTQATYVDDRGEKFVSMKTANGVVKGIPLQFANSIEKITSKDQYESFISNYKDICKSKPNFIEEIPYIANLRKEQTTRKGKMEEAEKEFQEKVSSVKPLIEKNQKEIDRLKELSKQQEESLSNFLKDAYLVTGKEVQRSENKILIIGNAVPKQGDSVFQKGLTVNGAILILYPTKEMFVTPEFYSPAVILSKKLFFVKSEFWTNPYGNQVIIKTFTSRPENVDLQEMNRLEAEIEKINNQLIPLQEENEKLKISFNTSKEKFESAERSYQEISEVIGKLIQFKE